MLSGDFSQRPSLLGSLINRSAKASYAGYIPFLFAYHLFQLFVIDPSLKLHVF